MSNTELKIEDFLLYESTEVKNLKTSIIKAEKNKKIINFSVGAVSQSLNALAFYNCVHIFLFKTLFLSTPQTLMLLMFSFAGLIYNIRYHKKITQTLISYNPNLVNQIQAAFFEAFNTKDQQLKILFAKYVDKSGDQISLTKSDLYDFFQRIDQFKANKKDIDLFLKIDEQIDKILEHCKYEISEKEKFEKINDMVYKELNSTNNISSKEFNFIKY